MTATPAEEHHVTALRLLADDEHTQLPPFDVHPAVLHPRIRPHCATCGRWVPEATVRKLPAYRWEDEDEYRATCAVHGEDVDVTWDEG